MKNFPAEYLDALAARELLPRNFLTITARTRDNPPEPVTVGFWSDLANVSALVIDPDTGSPVSRSFYGAGGLIQISDIPAVLGITVQHVTITMSQLHAQVEQAIRLYDCRQARVEIHDGLLDPVSRNLISPAEPMFVGFVDEIEIITPSEGELGGATLNCTSHTQELSRNNPATRSHADQHVRWPGDDFYIDTAVCGDWEHHWGQAKGKSQPEKPKGLFGWGNFLGFL